MIWNQRDACKIYNIKSDFAFFCRDSKIYSRDLYNFLRLFCKIQSEVTAYRKYTNWLEFPFEIKGEKNLCCNGRK